MRILIAAGLLIASAALGPMVASAARDSLQISGSSTSHDSQLGRLPNLALVAGSQRSKPKPVSIKAEIGYDGIYRAAVGWVPVRVTLINHTQQDITGRVQIPQSGQNNGPPLPYSGLYDMGVTLPAGGTKHVSLYIPGSNSNGQIHVQFLGAGGIKSSDWVYSNVPGTSDLVVGALSDGPADTSWISNVSLLIGVDVARLSPATLDPIPAVLANFDVIMLTNTDTSRLDSEQFSALRQYVHNGGILLLVGGPNWQETLHPLPAYLLPGTLSGSVVVSDLSGLTGVAPVPSLHRARTTLSNLTHVRGTVVARQGSTPLVVQDQLGSGSIEYLAFDPAVRPVAGWSHSSTFLGQILSQAAAPALARDSARGGSSSYGFPGCGFPGCGYGGMAAELANIPSAALPSLILFVALTILYIVLLGPANYLVLRRLRRLELSWISIPLLGVLCVALTFGVAYRLKGSTVLVNTISFVPLDGSGTSSVSMYVGLFAPVRGDYQIGLGGTALPAMVSNYNYYSSGPSSHSVGVRFDEGAGTDISLLSMPMWSSRAVALDTTLRVPGRVQSDLQVDTRGNIVGTVRNRTNLSLRDPVILAGRAVKHLPDIPAGATLRVHLRPNSEMFTRTQGVVAAYGNPSYSNYGPSVSSGPVIPFFPTFGSPAQCCYGPGLPAEKTFRDRVRNALASLPEAQTISTMGEVVLIGWSDASLGRVTVDGGTPNRRDLSLVAAPLSVRLPSGPFRLRSGTIGAQLTDVVPAVPSGQGYCCGSPIPNAIDIGSGGSATFRFDIPRAHRVHFHQLTLWVNAGGADGEDIGRVYDWKARVWKKADLTFGSFKLHNPDRFVSAQGAVLVKLSPTETSNDVRIASPYWDLQLVGSGVAS